MSDISLFTKSPERLEQKSLIRFDELLTLYLDKMPEANQEAKAWLPAIKNNGDEVALCYLNEMLVLAFAAGFSRSSLISKRPFAVSPEEIIKYATDPGFIPVMK